MVLVTVALVPVGPGRPWEVGAAAMAGGWASHQTGCCFDRPPDRGWCGCRGARDSVADCRHLAGRHAGAGGYWYGRDLIAVGTPLPGLRTGILPTPRAFPWPLTFAHALQTGADTVTALPHEFNAALGTDMAGLLAVERGVDIGGDSEASSLGARRRSRGDRHPGDLAVHAVHSGGRVCRAIHGARAAASAQCLLHMRALARGITPPARPRAARWPPPGREQSDTWSAPTRPTASSR